MLMLLVSSSENSLHSAVERDKWDLRFLFLLTSQDAVILFIFIIVAEFLLDLSLFRGFIPLSIGVNIYLPLSLSVEWLSSCCVPISGTFETGR